MASIELAYKAYPLPQPAHRPGTTDNILFHAGVYSGGGNGASVKWVHMQANTQPAVPSGSVEGSQ